MGAYAYYIVDGKAQYPILLPLILLSVNSRKLLLGALFLFSILPRCIVHITKEVISLMESLFDNPRNSDQIASSRAPPIIGNICKYLSLDMRITTDDFPLLGSQVLDDIVLPCPPNTLRQQYHYF